MRAHSAGIVAAMVFSITAPTAPASAPEPLEQPVIRLVKTLHAERGRRDVAASVVPHDGGAMIVGWTSLNGGDENGVVLRVDRDADIVWRRELGGTGEDLLWSIQPAPAGGFVAAGHSVGADGTGQDPWLISINDDGSTLWERSFPGPGDERLIALRPVPGGWIAAGQIDTRGAPGLDALVIRFDAEGKELSRWTLHRAAVDRAFAIVPMDDGGCVIAGMSGATREEGDAWIARLGPDGKELWSRVSERPGFGVAHDLARSPAPGGGLIAFGYAYLNDDRDTDGFTLPITDDGRLAPERFIGGMTNDRVIHGTLFPNGCALTIGVTQRLGVGQGDTRWDLSLHGVNPRGEAVWAARFGGDHLEFARCIAGPPNNVWIVGHSSSGRDSGSGIIIIRLDATAIIARG